MTLTVDLILAIVAALVLGWWLGDHFGYLRGEDDGKQTEKDRWVTYRREQEARKRQPPPEIRAKAGPLPLSMREAVDQHAGLQAWAGQQRKRVVTKTWTDAADIAPVLTAHTEDTQVPFQPQPARTSGAGTRTLPRLTDTGELRLQRAADWFEEKRREQAVWSHEFAERCEADRKELLA